jgi:hypothetical protein
MLALTMVLENSAVPGRQVPGRHVIAEAPGLARSGRFR